MKKNEKKYSCINCINSNLCYNWCSSAADWSFNFGSDTNSDGGSVNIDNNELKIQDEKFTIPDGYKENESARKLAADGKGNFNGAKVTVCELNKENETILIKVFFADGGIIDVTGEEGSVNKTIGGHEGFLITDKDGVTFDFAVNKKVVEIEAPSEADIEALLK